MWRRLAAQVVLAVFSEYEGHRKTLLHDLLEARLSQPTAATRSARRNYALPDGTRVQVFSALCALAIQSVAKLPPAPVEPADVAEE
eukprot:5662254-Prymnesium_polylepis.1